MVSNSVSYFPSVNVRQTGDTKESLLDRLEMEFSQCQVYDQALASLQELIGGTSEKAIEILKRVGREAIAIALKSTQILDPISSDHKIEEFSPESQSPKTLPEREALAWKSVAQEFDQIPALSGSPNLPRKPATNLTKVVKKVSKTDLAEQKVMRTWEQSLRQVGARLRQVRIMRSLSLDQLHARTLIPVYQLQALEEGNTKKLPEDIYIRGFIHRISAVLEIDESPLLASIPAPNPDKIVPSWYHPPTSKETGMYLRPAHLYLGYSALMLGAVSGLSLLGHQSAPQEAYETEEPIIPPEESTLKRQTSPKTQPGLKQTQSGVRVGADMAYPETLPSF